MILIGKQERKAGLVREHHGGRSLLIPVRYLLFFFEASGLIILHAHHAQHIPRTYDLVLGGWLVLSIWMGEFL